MSGKTILYIGEKRYTSADDPSMTVSVIWSEAGTKGARVEIKHDFRQGESLRTPIDTFKDSEWGLLKLFADVAIKGEKRYEVTWTFKARVSGEVVPRLADCQIEVQKKETPFAPKFFADFKVPEKMAP